MNTFFSRKLVLTSMVALGAVGLAACHPPHQNPSDMKVDTAQTQDPSSLPGKRAKATPTNVVDAAGATSEAAVTETVTAMGASDKTPLVNNCGSVGLERPASLTLNCSDQNDFLQDIVWDTWSEQLAQGTATRSTVNPNREIEDVQVVLGNPDIVDGVLVFNTITVDGTSINPEGER